MHQIKKEKKKRKKKSVRLPLCRLCRQLTVSQPSHRECAERELRFDHLSGLTDSVYQCVRCVWCTCVCWHGGGAGESVHLTQAYCSDKREISVLISPQLLIVQLRNP